MKTRLYHPQPITPGKGDGFWVNMDTAERIRKKCHHAAKLLVLFYLLNRVMTEAKSRKFHVAALRMAQLTGLKAGAIERHLCGLEYVGVLKFTDNKDGSFVVTMLGEVRL